jgi:hypothetical protein
MRSFYISVNKDVRIRRYFSKPEVVPEQASLGSNDLVHYRRKNALFLINR